MQEEDNAADLVERPPVVVVMGHVDHGKTSILDAIRKTNVTAGEAGGITQAHRRVPGQESTTAPSPSWTPRAMRRSPPCVPAARTCTDIAVLVVAADDGIMPQTVESINHAKAAERPASSSPSTRWISPRANPERVKQQLTKYELVPEEWGGDIICVPCPP